MYGLIPGLLFVRNAELNADTPIPQENANARPQIVYLFFLSPVKHVPGP